MNIKTTDAPDSICGACNTEYIEGEYHCLALVKRIAQLEADIATAGVFVYEMIRDTMPSESVVEAKVKELEAEVARFRSGDEITYEANEQRLAMEAHIAELEAENAERDKIAEMLAAQRADRDARVKELEAMFDRLRGFTLADGRPIEEVMLGVGPAFGYRAAVPIAAGALQGAAVAEPVMTPEGSSMARRAHEKRKQERRAVDFYRELLQIIDGFEEGQLTLAIEQDMFMVAKDGAERLAPLVAPILAKQAA